MGEFLKVFQSGKLLLSILEKFQAKKYVAKLREFGAGGSTVLLGRGTATNRILDLLGLGDTQKEIVFTVLDESTLQVVEKQRSFALENPSAFRGVMAQIDVRSGFAKTEDKMSEWKMICAIVNSGYADEAMAAARKVGAFGGTILNARGTGTEEDVKFCGITLVPEKEILLILAKSDTEPAILEAVRACKSFSAKGSGIIFSCDVEKFYNLGK